MKRKIKSVLAVFLSVLIILSIPLSAYAEDITDVVNVSYTYLGENATEPTIYDKVMPVTASVGTMDLFDDSFIDSKGRKYTWFRFDRVTFTTSSYKISAEGYIEYDIFFRTVNYSKINTSGSYCKIIRDGKTVDSSFNLKRYDDVVEVILRTKNVYKSGEFACKVQLNNTLYRDKAYGTKTFDLCVDSNSLVPNIITKSDNFFDTFGSSFNESIASLWNQLNNILAKIENLPTVINTAISNVIEKFKDITDSIASNIGSLINELKGNLSALKNYLNDTLIVKIKNSITDVTNQVSAFWIGLNDFLKSSWENLKTWFQNTIDSIGEWFKNLFVKLGEWFKNVGQWFSDLWTNISNKVVEIKGDIHDWFESLFVPTDGYFDKYKADFDTFFSNHFGVLYQAKQIFSKKLEELNKYLNGKANVVFDIPEISLPAKLFGNKKVLLEKQKFDLESIKKSHSSFVTVFNFIQMIDSAIIVFLLLNFGRKTLLQVLSDGQGGDGE